MKNMTLNAIAEAVDGQLILPDNYILDENATIQGVVSDNREVEKDYLFVPFVGEKVDAHRFIPDAFERGAMAVLSQVELNDAKGPYILVNDTPIALKRLAGFYRDNLNIPIIGVIGSVGKTSTKEMIASVLSVKFNVLKTTGNLNNEIGLPLTLCRIRDEHEVAVVEMGISEFGEMHRLGEVARPDMVVMTNIGQCHLENLKTRDGILQAKTEVFDHMKDGAVAILNGDDDKLATISRPELKKVFYGTNGQEINATSISAKSVSETAATVHTPNGDFDVVIPLPGEHNVMNGLAATAVGLELGLTVDEIKEGLSKATTIAGRNNIIKLSGITIIDDCYNANPVSMKNGIQVLAKATGRTIAVLGDMGELGEDEKALHYGISKALDDNGITMVFTLGDLSNEIVRGLKDMDSKCKSYHMEDMDGLVEGLLDVLKDGDTVLVKASHFMNFSNIIERLKEKLG